MTSVFYLFLALFVAGLITRNVYEQLKKAGRVDTKSKTLFAFIFAAMCILWISWFTMCPLDPQPLGLPDILRWIGLGSVIAGWTLAIGSILYWRRLEDKALELRYGEAYREYRALTWF